MLSIYQGNDKVFSFTRTDTNDNAITTMPQQMTFTVKQNYEKLDWLFRKTLNNGITQRADGTWEITIDAEDTANINPGKYVCDVKIINEHGKEYTIVKPQEFVVMPVATRFVDGGV